MHLVPGTTSSSIHGGTSDDGCHICRCTLFAAIMAAVSFAIGYLVGSVGTGVGYVSA